MNWGSAVFGVREIWLMNAGETAQADLPAARAMTFALRGGSAELSGDGGPQAVAWLTGGCTWALEAGGISLTALAILTGRTVSSTGSTPSRIRTLAMAGQACYPYFSVNGKAFGDDCAGNVRARVFRAKVTSLEGALQYGQFYVTKCSGVAVPHSSYGILMLRQYESDFDIVDTEMAAEALLADNASNPTTAVLGAAVLGITGAGWGRWRGPVQPVDVNAVDVSSIATVWTPAAGKTIRLMGGSITPTLPASVLFEDDQAGVTVIRTPKLLQEVPYSWWMGKGKLLGGADHVLKATGSLTTTITGHLYGCEE